jgi:hypothetical protein
MAICATPRRGAFPVNKEGVAKEILISERRKEFSAIAEDSGGQGIA